MWASTTATLPNSEMFTLSTDSNGPSEIAPRITAAKAKGIKLILSMTGGAHNQPSPGDTRSSVTTQLGCCLVLKNGVFTAGADGVAGNADDIYQSGVAVFDMTRWKARQDLFNTPAIKAAIAQGVTDGVVIGTNVMDEPHVNGQGDGNTWGPTGTMTKAIVDSLCGYVKAIFPTLPAGVAHVHTALEPTVDYKVCDFQISQFSYRFGTPAAWRDAALAYGNRGGTKILFSFNPVNGGLQDKDGTWDCATQGGIKGQSTPNCAMTPSQIVETATTLGKATCGGQVFWRFEDTLAARPEIKKAYTDAAAVLKAAPLTCQLKRR